MVLDIGNALDKMAFREMIRSDDSRSMFVLMSASNEFCLLAERRAQKQVMSQRGNP
jgi:hypothetical protein